MTSLSTIALAVARRKGWPIRQPSPKNSPGTEDGDHGFLALLGLDHDLDPAFLDVEDRVRRAALREDDGILGVLGDRATVIHGGEKHLRIEGR